MCASIAHPSGTFPASAYKQHTGQPGREHRVSIRAFVALGWCAPAL
jgi:hypothetical protein